MAARDEAEGTGTAGKLCRLEVVGDNVHENQYDKFLTGVISGLFSRMTSRIWLTVFSFQMRTGGEDDETCSTFVLHEEDHTLGNSLRYIIMKKYDE